MQLTMQRPIFPRTVLYLAVVLGLALLLALSMFLIDGSLRRLPAPNGLAKAGLIAYAANGDIYTRGLGGGDASALTTGDTFDAAPAFSPDGTLVAFWSAPSSAADPSSVPASLVVVNADGTGGRRVVVRDPGVNVQDLAPRWSPDSKFLAFAVANPTGQGLAVYSVETGELVSTVAYGWDPSWSPDGTQIAFAANQDGRSPGIWVADRDGQNAHRVTDALTNIGPSTDVTGGYVDAASIGNPRWSPDGAQIAFNAGYFLSRLFVVDPEGINVRELMVGTGGAENAVWSPTGSKLAFLRNTDPSITDSTRPLNVSVINSDGTGQIDLVSEPLEDTLAWAPDESRILAFLNAGLDTATMLALDPAGGQVDQFPVPENWGYGSWQRLAP
jgi:Tol biopolymer transport system component